MSLFRRTAAAGTDKGKLLLNAFTQSAPLGSRAAICVLIAQAARLADLIADFSNNPTTAAFVKFAHNDLNLQDLGGWLAGRLVFASATILSRGGAVGGLSDVQ